MLENFRIETSFAQNIYVYSGASRKICAKLVGLKVEASTRISFPRICSLTRISREFNPVFYPRSIIYLYIRNPKFLRLSFAAEFRFWENLTKYIFVRRIYI